MRPGFAEALSNRAIALHQLVRFDEAMDTCDRALAMQRAWDGVIARVRAALREFVQS